MNNSVLMACKRASAAWKTAFNQQDAAGCAAQYGESTTMIAHPFGTFTSKEAIQSLWQDIIDQGFNEVTYFDEIWEPAGEDGYILSAKWTMNKAFGTIQKEHWQIQSDGQARLVFDEFAVEGER